jgi:hypothetical protein
VRFEVEWLVGVCVVCPSLWEKTLGADRVEREIEGSRGHAARRARLPRDYRVLDARHAGSALGGQQSRCAFSHAARAPKVRKKQRRCRRAEERDEAWPPLLSGKPKIIRLHQNTKCLHDRRIALISNFSASITTIKNDDKQKQKLNNKFKKKWKKATAKLLSCQQKNLCIYLNVFKATFVYI